MSHKGITHEVPPSLRRHIIVPGSWPSLCSPRPGFAFPRLRFLQILSLQLLQRLVYLPGSVETRIDRLVLLLLLVVLLEDLLLLEVQLLLLLLRHKYLLLPRIILTHRLHRGVIPICSSSRIVIIVFHGSLSTIHSIPIDILLFLAGGAVGVAGGAHGCGAGSGALVYQIGTHSTTLS